MAYAHNIIRCVEASELATVGITAHPEVHSAETTFGQKYHSGTCTEDRQTLEDSLTNGLVKSKFPKQTHLDRTLTARQYESILLLLPIPVLAYLECFYAKLLKHVFVFNESPLQGQYCYSHLFSAFSH